jgi:hypothetical protein
VLAQPTENAPPEERVLPAGHQGAVGGSYGDGVPERLAEAAATLVRRPVDVIATYGTPAKTGKVIVRRVRAALTQAESGDCLRLLESLGAR